MLSQGQLTGTAHSGPKTDESRSASWLCCCEPINVSHKCTACSAHSHGFLQKAWTAYVNSMTEGPLPITQSISSCFMSPLKCDQALHLPQHNLLNALSSSSASRMQGVVRLKGSSPCLPVSRPLEPLRHRVPCLEPTVPTLTSTTCEVLPSSVCTLPSAISVAALMVCAKLVNDRCLSPSAWPAC